MADFSSAGGAPRVDSSQPPDVKEADMQQPTRPTSDPFALMMNPQAVFQAMERSDRLSRLQRRICRPLDKPLIPTTTDDVARFDREIDGDRDDEPDEFTD